MDLEPGSDGSGRAWPLASRYTSKLSPTLASFLSALLPGLGQIFLRRTKLGMSYLFVAVLLAVCFWPLRLPRFYYGGLLLVFALIALSVTASWSALRTETPFRRPGRYLWLLLLVPFSLFVAVLGWGIFLHIAGFKVYKFPSSAMKNTLFPGDVFVADMRAYGSSSPMDGEIIVYRRGNVVFAKRLIGMEGESVQGRANVIFLNGKRLEEHYAIHVGDAPKELVDFGPISIPRGMFFAVGDNRDISLDSRSPEVGLIRRQEILGKALYIISSQHDENRRILR
jgi:signal peptidase I